MVKGADAAGWTFALTVWLCVGVFGLVLLSCCVLGVIGMVQ